MSRNRKMTTSELFERLFEPRRQGRVVSTRKASSRTNQIARMPTPQSMIQRQNNRNNPPESLQFSQYAQEAVGRHQPIHRMPFLRPSLRTLRQAYDTRECVSVDYADSTVALAYQLAYTPFHILQALETFRDLTDVLLPRLRGQQDIELVCLCGGPGAEVVAFQLWLQEVGLRPRRLQVHVYDLNAEAWNKYANYKGTTILPQTNVVWQYHTVDFNDRQALSVESADVVMSMNCVNEFNVQPFARKMYKNMKSAAVVVASDLSGYRPNLKKLHRIREALSTSHYTSLYRDNKGMGYINIYGFQYTADMYNHFFEPKGICTARETLRTAYVYAVKQ